MKSRIASLGLAVLAAGALAACSKSDKPGDGDGDGQAPKAVVEPDAAQVKREIGEMVKAVFNADMGPIEKHSHEKAIAVVGDRQTFIETMERYFREAKDAGVRLVSFESGEPEFFSGEVHHFALVPTTVVMFAAGEESTNPGHQLGVKKKTDEIWKYIDCSSLTTEMAREWFPDFPPDRNLPSPE